jgi:hypothetical protein
LCDQIKPFDQVLGFAKLKADAPVLFIDFVGITPARVPKRASNQRINCTGKGRVFLFAVFGVNFAFTFE